MKAILTLILCAFYLLVATNTTINIHFCSGKVQTISLFGSTAKSCCGAKMQSKGCCHNKIVVFKAKDNHAVSIGTKLPVNIHLGLLNSKCTYPIKNPLIYSKTDIHFFKDESPPPLLKTPIFIRNRSIII
jgi:hypothetical protein